MTISSNYSLRISGYTFGLKILLFAIKISTNETTAVVNRIHSVRPKSNFQVN